MPGRPTTALKRARRVRGTPDETRERLVAAAAFVLNRDGYYGTDTNKIAAEAGYAAGTFYKHFADKREVLLAAYERWVTAEWTALGAELEAELAPRERVERIVDLLLDLHTRWRGLRASLLALLPLDETVRRFHRAQRRRQLDLLGELRARHGAAPRSREADAFDLFTLERVCDAIANGEARDLGLERARLVELLRETVARSWSPRR